MTKQKKTKIELPNYQDIMQKIKLDPTILNEKKDCEELIKLKMGLEIHQQLKGKKLFCNCPTRIHREDENIKPNKQIVRFLRATKSELDSFDIAAQSEAKKNKYFKYDFYDDCCCSVELDEEPPHAINQEALLTTYQVAKMMHIHPVDAIQVMRKIVVDGSNTSGFQRTMMVGFDGAIEVNDDKIGIHSIYLEEEACKIITKTDDYNEYGLDRLGIPLIEIATMPDIKTPGMCKDVATYIGMILRSTGRVMRGLGTIRQDINISIFNGKRTELKGAQDLQNMDKIVVQEILRQLGLNHFAKEYSERKCEANFVLDITSALKDCQSAIVKSALNENKKIVALKILNAKGLIGFELQTNKRIGTDLSEYIKNYLPIKGLFHSDELPNYGITDKDVLNVKRTLNCKEEDAFIMVAHSDVIAHKAIDLIKERLDMIKEGVVSEVRNVNADFTNSYMRPMPGSARMYPETDIPVTISSLDHVKIPELNTEKINRLEKQYELGKNLAEQIVKNDKSDLFEKIAKKIDNPDLKINFIADFLVKYEDETKNLCNKANAAEKADLSKVADEDIIKLFVLLNKRKITKQSLVLILQDYCTNEYGIEKSIGKFKLFSKEELKKEILDIIKHHKSENQNDDDKFKKALLGVVIGKLKYNALTEDITTAFEETFKF